MEMNLEPRVADLTIFKGDGGAYYTWSDFKSPVLSQTKLGAGKLVLNPRGFALPHYADCYKIGYVLQGNFRVGLVLPNSSAENVLMSKKGDAIPVPLGSVSWWYNEGDSDAEIVFLGETSETYTPAQFDYFFLTGAMGVLRGFSTEFISRAYDLSKTDSEMLVNSQAGVLVVKLAEEQTLPEPNKEASSRMVYNLDGARPQIHVNHGGSLTLATAENIHSLEQFGLGAKLVKLEANSMLVPMYTADGSFQLFYVSKGIGRVQIAGLNGKNVLDAKVHAGDLFVVPRFFAVAIMAEGEGLECFSIVTSSKPSFVELAGGISIWKTLSPLVLQAAFNVDPAGLVKSNITKGQVIVRPEN